MARKTKEDAEKTRQQLLDSALKLFSEKGPAQVTLAEIARDAGTTRGAIYWHFKDKCELIACLWANVSDPMEKAFETLVASNPENPLTSLSELTCSILLNLAIDTNTQQVFGVVQQACSHPELASGLSEMHCEQHQVLSAFLQPLYDRGELRSGLTADLAATLYIASVDGLISFWLIDPNSVDLTQHAGLLSQSWNDMIART